MLDILKHHHIAIGTKLEVKKKFSFDNSLEIRAGKHTPFTLSESVARFIWVRKTSKA
jgi:DtxR family Mn-dependent transcriptional regulator